MSSQRSVLIRASRRPFSVLSKTLILLLSLLLFLTGSALASGNSPTVDPIPDQNILPFITESGKDPKQLGSLLSFTISADDPENDPLLYRISQITKDGQITQQPGKMDLDAQSGAFSWGVRTSEIGQYEITFSIKDCEPPQGATDCSGNEVFTSVQVDVEKPQICNESSTTCTFLQANDTGDANGVAGSTGDFYLAGDYESDTRYHSVISVTPLPQLDFMDKLKGSDFSENPNYSDRGAEFRIWPGRVVVGNSSTAYTSGTYWAGHVRHDYLASQSAANKSYDQYTSNHHFWFPEHRDHDDKDHYYAKVPYVSNSQGSSGSERDELAKFVRTLAAFKTPVKDQLRVQGLIMPTLQMIFRRTRVANDTEYLSGLAHPNAFDNVSNQDAMVQMAYGIDPGTIPPIVQIEATEHTYNGASGRDYFSSGSEVHFETPASVAFIFRGKEYTKRAVISAQQSYDLNNRPLTYHWAVLKGDPANVRITPLVGDSSIAEIEIDYHPEATIDGSTRLTNLVEVGVFVHNGYYYSAPAFVTSYSLHCEERSYQNGLIQEIQHVDRYVDPRIASKAAWDKDVFHYDGSNVLTGWTRHYNDGSTADYDAEGHCQGCVGRTASGRVAYQGRGLANVLVTADPYSNEEGPYETRTDADGYFSFSHVNEMTYYFRFSELPTGYAASGIYQSISGSDVANLNPTVNCAAGFRDEGGFCVGYDDDLDGVDNENDCAPNDDSKWKDRAYPDYDEDGIRNSESLSTVQCFGFTPPAGYTLNENGPDNCPTTANPNQRDRDQDGIGDACDPNPDPEPRLEPNRITGVWNGFNLQGNVIECSSLFAQTVPVSLTITDYRAQTLGQRVIEFPAYGTSHIILNEFDIVDSYGTYLLEVPAELNAGTSLRCRTLFYRDALATDYRQVEYAYSIPAGLELTGTSSGLYNSMNPEAGNPSPVLNWLSVYNPGENPFSAEVKVYNQDGSSNTEQSFRIEALAPGDRYDAPLGHPEGQKTGFYMIVPDNTLQVYGAFLGRYSSRISGDFNFAFTLLASKGLSDSGAVAASTMGPAINWGEIANISHTDVLVEIEVFNRDGDSLSRREQWIAGRAQHHIYLNEIIGEQNVGYFRVRVLESGNGSGSILVQSLYYGQSAANAGQVIWAYGSQAEGDVSSKPLSQGLPINTFYNSANWLKLFTLDNNEIPVVVTVYAMDGSEISTRFSSIALLGSGDYGLHEEVGPNFAGMVVVDSPIPLTMELLRVFPVRNTVGVGGNIGYITNIKP